jgi:hypothetical protein
MFYCHFLIYDHIQNGIALLNYDRSKELKEKNYRNIITKRMFQCETLNQNLNCIYLFCSKSIGSYSLNKRSFLDTLYEVKYKIIPEYFTKKYYMGKFDFKNGNITLFNVDNLFKQVFDGSKPILKNLSFLNKKTKYQNYREDENIRIFVFTNSNSKLSTGFNDELSIGNSFLINNFSCLFKLSDWLFKKKLSFDCNFLKIKNLFVSLNRNLMKKVKNLPAPKITSNLCLYGSLKIYNFFTGFYVFDDFILSSEIIFYNKTGKFNPTKFLFDRYFELYREKNTIYTIKIFKFSLLSIGNYIVNQFKNIDLRKKKNKISNNYSTKMEIPKVCFQKKFIERIEERLWNIKLGYSEFNNDLLLKRFKSSCIKKPNQKIYIFNFKCIFSVFFLILNSNKFLFRNNFKLNNLFYYKLIRRCLITFNLYYNIKGWNNYDLDESLFKTSNQIESVRKKSNTFTSILIYRKYINYNPI